MWLSQNDGTHGQMHVIMDRLPCQQFFLVLNTTANPCVGTYLLGVSQFNFSVYADFDGLRIFPVQYLLYFRDLLTSRVPAIGYLLCEGEASKASCDVDTKYRSIRMIKRSWYHRSSRAEAEGECNLKEEFAA